MGLPPSALLRELCVLRPPALGQGLELGGGGGGLVGGRTMEPGQNTVAEKILLGPHLPGQRESISSGTPQFVP